MAERNSNGRFANGHSGGPGRPKKERELKYLQIGKSSVPFHRWKKVILKALDQAEEGDKDARKFLAEYLMGKPKDILEIIERNEMDEMSDEDLMKLENELEAYYESDSLDSAKEEAG